MNFEWDPETAEMRATITAFCRARLQRGNATTFEDRVFRERWAESGRAGILGVSVPTAYGGTGLSPLAAAGVMEAVGEGTDDLGFAFSLAAHVFACAMPIVEFGSEQQKTDYLPRMCSGEIIAAHAITEPSAGSDTLALQMTAQRRGEDYVLRGSKAFTTNAPLADVFLVHAVTRPGAGFFGLSAFLIERGTPGVSVGRPYDKIGLCGSPTSDVYFDDCIVPASRLLGPEGGGAALFAHSMNWERTCLFAIYLGAMERQLAATIGQAKARSQFGSPIARFQSVGHRIVDMKLRLESARLLVYRAAWGLEHQPEDTIAPALAKIAVSEAAVQSGLDAIQIHGGSGVVSGEIERMLRDALPARIFSGTNEIQRNNVARAIGLGDLNR